MNTDKEQSFRQLSEVQPSSFDAAIDCSNAYAGGCRRAARGEHLYLLGARIAPLECDRLRSSDNHFVELYGDLCSSLHYALQCRPALSCFARGPLLQCVCLNP